MMTPPLDLLVLILVWRILGAAVKAENSCGVESSNTFLFTAEDLEGDKIIETIENFMTQCLTGNDVTIMTEVSEQLDGQSYFNDTSLDSNTKSNDTTPTVLESTKIIPSTNQRASTFSDGSAETSVSQITTAAMPVCEAILRRGGCIWTVIHEEDDVSFKDGLNYCEGKHSAVAKIIDDEDFNSALRAVRAKLPANRDNTSVWIEGTIDPSTSITGSILENSCNPVRKWLPAYPNDASNDVTNLLLYAYREPNRRYNGMINKISTFKANGVVCFFHGDEIQQTYTSIAPYYVGDCCKTSEKRHCFWTELHEDINFNTAKSICKHQKSVPAVIPDEKTYNAIMNDVREKNNGQGVKIWTGMTFNAKTNTTSPENAFYDWRSGCPEAIEQKTSIDLFVSLDGNSNTQGMGNTRPNWLRSGVVCQKENTKRGRDETVD